MRKRIKDVPLLVNKTLERLQADDLADIRHHLACWLSAEILNSRDMLEVGWLENAVVEACEALCPDWMPPISTVADKGDEAETLATTDSRSFVTPDGARWQDVKIRFRDGHTVSVEVLGARRILNYSQMGMADTRNANPTVQWILLRDFAAGYGTLTWDSWAADRKNQKRRERLSRNLQAFFGIDGDPIEIEGNGWRTCFQLEPH